MQPIVKKRILENGNYRILENGNNRILEKIDWAGIIQARLFSNTGIRKGISKSLLSEVNININITAHLVYLKQIHTRITNTIILEHKNIIDRIIAAFVIGKTSALKSISKNIQTYFIGKSTLNSLQSKILKARAKIYGVLEKNIQKYITATITYTTAINRQTIFSRILHSIAHIPAQVVGLRTKTLQALITYKNTLDTLLGKYLVTKIKPRIRFDINFYTKKYKDDDPNFYTKKY